MSVAGVALVCVCVSLGVFNEAMKKTKKVINDETQYVLVPGLGLLGLLVACILCWACLPGWLLGCVSPGERGK